VKCAADHDCDQIRVWTYNGLCQAGAASAKCVAGVCSSSSAPLCVAPRTEPASVTQCGLGYARERFVGRCASDSLARQMEGCDEGLSAADTKYERVLGPDKDDSNCMDFYTSQVVQYAGRYLAFPGRFVHMPLPPAWGKYTKGTSGWAEDDGRLDTALLHSRDGRSWSYIGGDRSAFFGLGRGGGPPAQSNTATPGANDPRTWRESMALLVRGLAVRGDRIFMYGFGCRCRHNQDDSTVAEGGGGMIRRLSLRLDGFASIGDSKKQYDAPGTFVTRPQIMQGERLLVNVVVANGGGIAVGIRAFDVAANTSTPIDGRVLSQ
jgi:hypothetical protein